MPEVLAMRVMKKTSTCRDTTSLQSYTTSLRVTEIKTSNMVAIRSLLVAIAVLGTSTLSLAAPSDASSIEERGGNPQGPFVPIDARSGEDTSNDSEENPLNTRAVCYTTSKKSMNCQQGPGGCPSSWCVMSKNGKKCTMKKDDGNRPIACGLCSCRRGN